MKKLNLPFIPEKLRWKILIKCLTAAVLPLAVPCMAVPTAESLSLSLSAAKAVSAPPAATNMP